ncbi:MAG: hypothetical protein ACRC8A_17700 [Microcoleaceae cyanobacterium]
MNKVEDIDNGQGAEILKPVNLEVAPGSARAEKVAQSASTQIQVRTAMIMPNRPIGESHLEIVGTLMGGHRPIMRASSVSSVVLVDSEDSVGSMANRPIAAIDLHVTGMLMNRPVASNEIDDPFLLMGYLD